MQFDRHYQIHAYTPAPLDLVQLQQVMEDIGLSVFTAHRTTACSPESRQKAVVIGFTITSARMEGEKEVAVEAAGRVAKLLGIGTVLLTVTPLNAALVTDKGEVISLDEPEDSQIITAQSGEPNAVTH